MALALLFGCRDPTTFYVPTWESATPRLLPGNFASVLVPREYSIPGPDIYTSPDPLPPYQVLLTTDCGHTTLAAEVLPNRWPEWSDAEWIEALNASDNPQDPVTEEHALSRTSINGYSCLLFDGTTQSGAKILHATFTSTDWIVILKQTTTNYAKEDCLPVMRRILSSISIDWPEPRATPDLPGK
jgi:hypothetical protein